MLRVRQSKYLINIVGARPPRRQTRHAGQARNQGLSRPLILISGIETMHMIRKGQLEDIKDQVSSAANQFWSLAF